MVNKKNKSKKKYFYAVGRRREATAVVKLYRGKEATLVNGLPVKEYFSGQEAELFLKKPFELTATTGKFYALIKTRGGGKNGQMEAAILAISRALEKVNREKYRPFLKTEGLLTVDSRTRERRKAGQMGRARKKKQSPKR